MYKALPVQFPNKSLKYHILDEEISPGPYGLPATLLASSSSLAYYRERYQFTDWDSLASAASALPRDDDPAWTERYRRAIGSQLFIPAGNTLTTAGSGGRVNLQPNCCVLGEVHEGNFKAQLALFERLQRARIGCGVDLSRALDPVGLLRRLAEAGQRIKMQFGRPQRGCIATLSAAHPCVVEFIRCKNTSPADLYNFNISVKFTDEQFRPNGDGRRAREADRLIREVALAAHRTGDPGVLFEDRIPIWVPELGRPHTVVPCGEQAMYDLETCNLGNVNIGSEKFIVASASSSSSHGGSDGTSGPTSCQLGFNYHLLREVVHTAVRYMDGLIDQMRLPDRRMEQMTRRYRRIGLGVMGWADLLRRLRMPYESKEALAMASQVAWALNSYADEASRELALQRGVPEGLRGLDGHISRRRNITVTCLPPTGGTNGLTGNVGYSIEPVFSDGEAILVAPDQHLDMVAAWQEHIENAISKTVNMSYDATPFKVECTFRYAFLSGYIKSCTIYRDKSREGQAKALERQENATATACTRDCATC